MTDSELIEFAAEFRDGILDGGSSDGACGMVCWPLAGLLRFHGLECATAVSELDWCNHIWIRLPDGRALDPTIDQFNSPTEQWPPVYLGPPTKYHGGATCSGK